VHFTTEFGLNGPPHIRLERRSWDDGGYKTLFEVALVADDETQLLGTTKILQLGEKQTTLPHDFERLPESYCSLGQSPQYDREASAIEQRWGLDITHALRDVRRLSDTDHQECISRPGFQTSLARFAPARFLYASKFGGIPRALRVDLRVELPGFDAPHVLTLDLDPDRLLGRVAVIIGENGTGKTRFLDAVARALSGIEPRWIAGGTPSISRVIALSCNAFDQFLIPTPIIEGSYFYVGLRSRTGMIDVKTAANSIARAFSDNTRDGSLHPHADRIQLWRDVMSLIGLRSLTDSIEEPDFELRLARLGAGLKFACYTLTRLVTVIEPRSFVLFDEPENHTHPRLLSTMMRALHEILERFESFALVASHSPLVAQEIPAKQVHTLQCFEDGYPKFTTPVDETFGASLGELLRKVFGIDYQERNFELLVRELVQRHGVAKVRDELGHDLALPARLLLEKLGEQEGHES
jgi:hypothetical protein